MRLWIPGKSILGNCSLVIKVDNRTRNIFKPATNPKSYYLKYGIVVEPPVELEPAKPDASSPITAAKIAVEQNYTDGILGIIAFNCVDGGQMGRMVCYFLVPQSDSEDNVFRVSTAVSWHE